MVINIESSLNIDEIIKKLQASISDDNSVTFSLLEIEDFQKSRVEQFTIALQSVLRGRQHDENSGIEGVEL